MTEEIRRFREALRRHRRRPFLYRTPYWHGKFKTMERIDEIILIPNENDRYGGPYISEEADADHRWVLHDAEHHERRQAIVEHRNHGWDLGTSFAMSQRQSASETLALETAHNASDADADAEGTLGLSHDQIRETAQPESSPFSSGCDAHLSRATAESSTAKPGQLPSPETYNGHSDVADRSKENNKRSQVCSNTNGAGATGSDSSDDEGIDADTDEAKHERILQLFEDFPTLIQKARHLSAIDSDPDLGWNHIEPARLPPRVRKYLAEFTVLDAAGFPDGVYPDLALNGGGSHRWLLATARKEFVCDTSTLDVWPARGPRALPKCNWQFWDEPNDTNHGPEIIVTEPSGVSHYLIDLDTFRLKVRQRLEIRSGQVYPHVEKSRMEAMASFDAGEMEMEMCDDDQCGLPSYASGRTRWWLRWGRMFFRPGSQPQSILPMYQNDPSFDNEKATLLGYDVAQDEKLQTEKAAILHPTGIAGTFRNLVYCYSKSWWY